jgi:glycosyltransferase involved in cell wall biosynthesis
MQARQALFYLTYNGVYNFTNGIGTQTQLLLRGLECLQEAFARECGGFDVHVVCPLPDQYTWGYDEEFYRCQRQRLTAIGGQLHLVPYKTHPQQELWEIPAWQTLCQQGARQLAPVLTRYDRSLLICVDQPWLHLPHYLPFAQRVRMPAEGQQRSRAGFSAAEDMINTLLVLYNTAFIRNWHTPDAAEVAWEQQGLAASRPGSGVHIADICPSFTIHLRTHFRLNQALWAPYTASILVDDDEFVLQPPAALAAMLQRYNIPLHEDIVLAFGRAAPIKGFELVIPALEAIRERCHFVLISVPYSSDDPQQRLYDRLLAAHGIRATHITHFTRELPRALCQWPRTRMVLLPSQQETFSNIFLEVALWARQSGPVVVASRIGGFLDQIEPGVTGFFLNLASPDAMAHTLRQVLDLPAEPHAAIRRQAAERVVRQYDFRHNFPATLRWFWGDNRLSADPPAWA